MGQVHDEVICELTLLQGDVGCSWSGVVILRSKAFKALKGSSSARALGIVGDPETKDQHVSVRRWAPPSGS